MKEDKWGVTVAFETFFGDDASAKNLSAFLFDLISVLEPLIKEQGSLAHNRFAFEPHMVRVK